MPRSELIKDLMAPLDTLEQEQLENLMKRIGLPASEHSDRNNHLHIMEGKSMSQKWVVDASHTNVEFAVKHMMIATVRGRFSTVEGVIEGDPDDLTAARFEATIDADSIDTRKDDRDQHLRSADFFDTENHPKSPLRAPAAKRRATGSTRSPAI